MNYFINLASQLIWNIVGGFGQERYIGTHRDKR
jgi:hypothetical protein